MGSVGIGSGRTLRSHFHLCLHILLMSIKDKNHWGHVGRLEMGILGPQCPAMSRQHSFTYSMLCVHQRGALMSGHRDQTDSSEFYGNFSSAVNSVCAAGGMQILHLWLNNAVFGSLMNLFASTWTSGHSCDTCTYSKMQTCTGGRNSFWTCQMQRPSKCLNQLKDLAQI